MSSIQLDIIYESIDKYIFANHWSKDLIINWIKNKLAIILWKSNQIFLIENEIITAQFPITTSRNWFWNQLWQQTSPTWLMQIENIIWTPENDYTIFHHKLPYFQTNDLELDFIKKNWLIILKHTMLARIFILNWIEPHNQNIKNRNIYIHWTLNWWILKYPVLKNKIMFLEKVFLNNFSNRHEDQIYRLNPNIWNIELTLPKISIGCFWMFHQDCIKLATLLTPWDTILTLEK